MRVFRCDNCHAALYFENIACLNCGRDVAFDPTSLTMATVDPGDTDGSRGGARSGGRLCANRDLVSCNWFVTGGEADLCDSCNRSDQVPDLDAPGNLDAWAQLELAKRKLLYSLYRFGLPIDAAGDEAPALRFRFLENAVSGHADGAITIDIVEANSVERERQRAVFDEPYRTLLGHLRHECGHYYWMRLIENSPRVGPFRDLFGDERTDYTEAISRYHANGPSISWEQHYISAYASAHPWEDWAETWAHYFHIVDALETAQASDIASVAADAATTSLDVYRDASFESLIDHWIPLTLAINNLNRSMGHPDFYPVVIPPDARAKLRFVHEFIRGR